MKTGISTAVLLACICIVACIVTFYMHKEPYQLELLSQDEFIFNQLTTKICSERFCDLAEPGTEMPQLLEKLGVTKYKCYDTAPGFYTIIETTDIDPTDNVKTDSCLLQLDFDSSGKYIGAIIIGELSSHGKFEQLREGMTLDDVLEADPKAKMTSFSWSEAPQISYHFSSDGYACMCWYESGIVTDILRWTI